MATANEMKFLPLLFALVITGASAAPQQPWFQLDAHAKRALAEKAATIRAGDPYKSVIRKLGKPTHDETLARKESDRVIGRALRYDAVVQEQDLVNDLMDEFVEVFLDEHNRVRSVYIRVTLE